jgi:hypothetical protein
VGALTPAVPPVAQIKTQCGHDGARQKIEVIKDSGVWLCTPCWDAFSTSVADYNAGRKDKEALTVVLRQIRLTPHECRQFIRTQPGPRGHRRLRLWG